MANKRYIEKDLDPTDGQTTEGEKDQSKNPKKKSKKISRKGRNMEALASARKMKGSHHVIPVNYN
jgi:hypothetical protein